jgi:hypothetical protein
MPSAVPAFPSVTLGASPASWSMPQLAPCVISSLWLNWRCGAHAFQALPGW